MKKCLFYIITLIILLHVVSCTSTRWSVIDSSAIDYNDYSIIQNEEFLKEVGSVTPDDPILRIQLFSYTTHEYAEKVLVRRSIQEYRPRPGMVALGLAGAVLSIYAANADVIAGSKNPLKRITLNSAGGLLALSGFLSMKPVGEPRDTGEERLLRKTGTILKTDTLEVISSNGEMADISVRYGNRLVFEEQDHPISSGLLEVNLGTTLSALNIKDSEPEPVTVAVEFQDSTYTFNYPVQSILHPFARITAPITPLRNAPIESQNTVLAELVEGGQLQIIDRSDPKWYRVLYGISENYILRRDAELIWRSSDFARNNQVVAVPQIPFGNIDVETNIPILRNVKEGAASLIITNESYEGNLTSRTYAHRDGELMGTYLENSLGYPSDHIFTVQDLSNVEQLSEPLSKIDSMATDSTELFIYLSGYGNAVVNSNGVSLGFVPVTDEDQAAKNAVDLSAFFRRIASIPSQKTIIVADIDFSHEQVDSLFGSSNATLEQPLRKLSEILTGHKPQSAVLFGAEFGQRSAVYLSQEGEDKKHRIFPYFIARALQRRHTNLAEIYQFLERNVSYHARRLHDQPQDPQLFGKVSVDLADE